MTATSSDTTSGIPTAGYVFSLSSPGTGWTPTGSGASRTYSFAGTAVPGTVTITVTDNAGLSSATTVALTPDGAGPAASAPGYPGTKAAAGTGIGRRRRGDGQRVRSGIDSARLRKRHAHGQRHHGHLWRIHRSDRWRGCRDSFVRLDPATVGANKCYQFELVVTDNVGNSTTTACVAEC